MKNSPATTDTISLSAIDDPCFSFPLRGRKTKRVFFELLSAFIPFRKDLTTRHLLAITRNLFSSNKENIQICLATVVIGAIFLGSIFVFFSQLAEYGW